MAEPVDSEILRQLKDVVNAHLEQLLHSNLFSLGGTDSDAADKALRLSNDLGNISGRSSLVEVFSILDTNGFGQAIVENFSEEQRQRICAWRHIRNSVIYETQAGRATMFKDDFEAVMSGENPFYSVARYDDHELVLTENAGMEYLLDIVNFVCDLYFQLLGPDQPAADEILAARDFTNQKYRELYDDPSSPLQIASKKLSIVAII